MVTPGAVQKLVDKLRTQKHITIAHDTIPGANHFFANELDLLMKSVDDLPRLSPRPELPDPLSYSVQISTLPMKMIPQAIISRPRCRSSGRIASFTPKISSRIAAIMVMASAAEATIPTFQPFTAS